MKPSPRDPDLPDPSSAPTERLESESAGGATLNFPSIATPPAPETVDLPSTGVGGSQTFPDVAGGTMDHVSVPGGTLDHVTTPGGTLDHVTAPDGTICAAGDAAERGRHLEQALSALNTAIREDYKDAVALQTDPDLASLRKESAFIALVERIKSR